MPELVRHHQQAPIRSRHAQLFELDAMDVDLEPMVQLQRVVSSDIVLPLNFTSIASRL